MGRPASKVVDVVVPGPLAPFAAEFRSVLGEAGYTPLSAVVQLRLMVHLSRWLDSSGLSAADLDDERLEGYLASRRAAGYSQHLTRRGLAPLLTVLAAQRARPMEAPTPPEQTLLASFERYLATERGLAASTVSAYVRYADRFVSGYAPDGDVASVTTADVTCAVVDESARVSAASAQYFVAGLRSLLRFCHVEGLVGADLAAAALTVTGRRTSALPRGISSSDTEALLGSCDRRRAVGRRDHAVIVTLLRLGLRASEVAVLSLDDLDWRAGEIVVHGKGNRDERLPLPVDVGEAIVGYLRRGRPKANCREVFLTATAPTTRLGRGAVSSIVRRACVRAGLPAVGAHRLRHTLACEMVRTGVPLPDIAQVLRHGSLVSTSVYARVDVEGLRTLAQSWPSGARS